MRGGWLLPLPVPRDLQVDFWKSKGVQDLGLLSRLGKISDGSSPFTVYIPLFFSIMLIARWIRLEETKQKPFLYRELTPGPCERREERLGNTTGTHANSGESEGATFPSVTHAHFGVACASQRAALEEALHSPALLVCLTQRSARQGKA